MACWYLAGGDVAGCSADHLFPSSTQVIASGSLYPISPPQSTPVFEARCTASDRPCLPGGAPSVFSSRHSLSQSHVSFGSWRPVLSPKPPCMSVPRPSGSSTIVPALIRLGGHGDGVSS